MNIEWLKLVNFGEYRHSKGIQVLDASSAQAISNSFHSIRGRLARKLQGIPVFIGHPDDPEFPSGNGKVYGHIGDLKVEDDALWISVRWTEIGNELFKNGILRYLSPRWLTVQTKCGKLLPRRLLSVGLTNHPNIPCEHVARVETVADTPIGKESFEGEHLQGKQADASVHSGENCGGGGSTPIAKDAAETVEELSAAQSAEDKISEKVSPALPKKIVLHTVSQTETLLARNAQMANKERILRLVFDRMQKFSENYGDAWMAVKRSNPALFQKHF